MPVTLKILEWASLGLIDRQLVEIGATKARQLRVLIGEEAPLQQGIFGRVDARRHIRGQKGDLLRFGEEIIRISVQDEASDDFNRDQLFGNELRCI